MALAAIKDCEIAGWLKKNKNKKLSHTFRVKFRAFEKEFLQNHTVNQAQISEITEIIVM